MVSEVIFLFMKWLKKNRSLTTDDDTKAYGFCMGKLGIQLTKKHKQTKTKLDVMICIETLCWRLDYVWIVKADFVSGSIHWRVQNWWHYFKMMKTGKAWLEEVGHWGPFEDKPCF